MLTLQELVEVVASDLHFLVKEWDAEIEDHSLRRSSTVLRRLLVEGELQRAWKHSGFQREPTIVASTLDPILSEIDLSKIHMASAGGATYRGLEVRGVFEIAGALPLKVMHKVQGKGLPEISLGLRHFAQATCLVLNAERVNRHQVIKFVANRLGGAHSTAKVERKDEHVYKLLDTARNQYEIAGKSLVFFELLAVGQALAKSADLLTFLSKVGGSDSS